MGMLNGFPSAAESPERGIQITSARAIARQMTLFKLRTSYSMPAVGGDWLMAGWRHCESKINAVGQQ